MCPELENEDLLGAEEDGEYENEVLDALERLESLAERTTLATERMAEALEAVAEQLQQLTAE